MSGEKQPETSSSASADHKALHPVYSVTNIQNKIQTLDGTTCTYSAWVKLFTLHARSYKVLHHIDGTKPPKKTHATYETWAEIDAIVLQWIYGTISKPYLARVLDTKATALQVWNKLKNIFLSNKKARAAALEKRFTNLTLASCSSLDDYCQKLQDLAEQLNDVDHVVDESRLVVQLVNGLLKEFDACATVINQNDTSWDDAREAIDLEKQRQDARAEQNHSALVAPANGQTKQYVGSVNHSGNNTFQSGSQQQPTSSSPNPNYFGNNYQLGYRGRGRGRRGGRGYGRNGGRFQQYAPNSYYPQQQFWTTPPPYPHPAQGMWPNQWGGPQQPTGFGQQPHFGTPINTAASSNQQAVTSFNNMAQANVAFAPPGFTTQQQYNLLNPQELGQALQAVNLNNDPWFMDSGASSHLTADPGPRNGKATF